jgi:hypothetical protein
MRGRGPFLVSVHRHDCGHNRATNRPALIKKVNRGGGWDGIVLTWCARSAFAIGGVNSMARVGEGRVFAGYHLAA